MFRQHYFSNELDQCQSESEYEGLKDALELFATRTGVDFSGPLDAIRDALSELDEQRSRYEDMKYEEWKEARYERHVSETSVDEMFNSLRPLE